MGVRRFWYIPVCAGTFYVFGRFITAYAGSSDETSPAAPCPTAPRRPPIPSSVRFQVLARDNYTCKCCGRKPPEVTLHVDHRTPRSLGGTDDPENLVTACLDCNLGKSNRFMT